MPKTLKIFAFFIRICAVFFPAILTAPAHSTATELEQETGDGTDTSDTTITCQCDAGQYCTLDDPVCKPCPAGSYTNEPGQYECTACTGGKTTNGTGQISCEANCKNSAGVSEWETATFEAGIVTKLCTPKSDGCAAGYYHDGNNQCESCPAPYTKSHTGATGITDCYATVNPGKYLTDGNIKDCPTGQYNSSMYTLDYNKTSGCAECPVGTTSNDDFTSCTDCTNSENVYEWETGGKCKIKSCEPGYEPNGQECKQCDEGHFSSDGTKCTPAQEGYYVPNKGAIGQTQCLAGSYTDQTGQSACTDAQEGYYVSKDGATEQTPCPTVYPYSAASATSIDGCYLTTYTGYYVANAGAGQTPCPANSYCTGGFNIKYQAVGGDASCSDETQGLYPYSDADATSKKDCYAIVNPGKYLTDGNIKDCPTGQYNSNTLTLSYNNTSKCTDAKEGYYVPNKGATKPTKCSAGSYTDQPGQSKCTDAQKGHYVSGDGATGQTPCPVGSYTDKTGKSACTACQSGTTTSGIGQTSCNEDCAYSTGVSSWETATFEAGIVNNLCKPNSSGCSAGYYYDDMNTQCKSCDAETSGVYPYSAASATSIDGCYLTTYTGYYVANAGAGQTPCPEQYYCTGGTPVYFDGTGGSSQCRAPYTESHTGATYITDCYATVYSGQYLTDDNIKDCPSGQYNSDTYELYYKKTSKCTDAKEGYYVSEEGATKETQCPPGTTSYTGATAVTECFFTLGNSGIKFCNSKNSCFTLPGTESNPEQKYYIYK